MGDNRLIDTSLRLPGRKGCVLLDNMKTDPSSSDRKYPVGTVWLNRVLGTGWLHISEGSWELLTPQSLANYIPGLASSTDNAVVQFSGISGKLIKESPLVIDNNGMPTNASQSAFKVSISAALSNVTGNGTSYQVPFNLLLFDQNSDVNLSNGIFTCPSTGIYYLTSALMLDGLAGVNLLFFYIETSSDVMPGEFFNASVLASVAGFLQVKSSGILNMTAGDTARVKLYGIGAGADTVDIASFAAATCFSGVKIC